MPPTASPGHRLSPYDGEIRRNTHGKCYHKQPEIRLLFSNPAGLTLFQERRDALSRIRRQRIHAHDLFGIGVPFACTKLISVMDAVKNTIQSAPTSTGLTV